MRIRLTPKTPALVSRFQGISQARAIRGWLGNEPDRHERSLLLPQSPQQAAPRGGDLVIDASDRHDGCQARVVNAEQPGQFALEMEQRTLRARLSAKVVECAPDKVVQLRRRMTGFGREFDEFDEVRRERDPRIIAAEPLAGVAQFRLAKRVKFAFCALCNADLALEEKVENPGKAVLRT